MASKSLRIGILGAASIARQFAAALQDCPSATVMAIASRDKDRAHEFAKSFAVPKHFDSYKALLRDPAIDIVYIPLPNDMHAEWAIKAAEHGKHILCEKPLCLGLAQAKAMFAAAKLYKVMLLEAYPYWFQPQTREMLSLLQGGAIGEVQSIQAAFGFTIAQPKGNIRLNPERGGGALLDAGSYALSLIRLVMGEAPIRVSARPIWASSGVDISMQATLEFSRDRIAQLSCAMNVANHRHATIVGSSGVIETEFLNHTSAHLPSQLRVRKGAGFGIPFENIQSATGNGFRFGAEAFADVINRRDVAAIARAEKASLDIAQTLEAIGLSARTGKTVELPQPYLVQAA
jgi:predicted dehydrogenase